MFRHAPDDLHPVLDSPEAIHAAEFFSDMLRSYGPDGVLSYTYDQVLQGLKDGSLNYATSNETFLVQMKNPGSKVSATCSLVDDAGRAGRPVSRCRGAWLGHSYGRAQSRCRLGVHHLGDVQTVAAADVP